MKTFKAYLEEKKDGPCWDDYEMVGMKKKNGKEVPNCVPKKENFKSDAQRKAVWASKNDAKKKKNEDVNEAKMVRFIVMPTVIKGKLKPTDSIEVKASSAKEAREKAAKEFGFGIRPSELKAVAKYPGDKHMNEEAPANATGPAVDMNPTGKAKKMDKRSRFAIEKMFKRAQGVK
jgi:hypothetical protein